jgi:arylsulfatase A-like enzyme
LRAIALITLLLTASASAEQGACTSRPNVLVIELAGVRGDATSLHPEPRNETPVLRQLAGRGVNFARAYSTSDFPGYGHFSLSTGFKVGHQSRFDRPEAGLPHQFARLGYRTFAVVANQNVIPEKKRSMAGFADQVLFIREWESLDERAKEIATQRADERLQRYGAATDDFGRLAAFSSPEAAVERLLPKLTGPQPFFGLLSLQATDPWLPDPETYTQPEPVKVPDLRNRKLSQELRFSYGIEDDARREQVLRLLDRAWGRPWSTTLDLSPEQIAVYRNRYHAVVRDLDRAVGKVMKELEERALLDSTIVVIVSLMGHSFGEADLITASFNSRGDFEVSRRVPLLMMLPPCYGVQPQRVTETASVADVAPTLYELAGIDPAILWRGNRYARGTSLTRFLPRVRAADVAQVRAFAPPLTQAGLLDDSAIAIGEQKDVAAKRNAVVRHVWGPAGFPADVLPESVVRDIPSPVAGLTGIRRVDELRIALAPTRITPAYHFIPARPNGGLVVVHQGHGCRGLDDPDSGLPPLIAALLGRGYGVLGLEMPQQRPDDCIAVHEPLFAQMYGQATAYRFFFEPIAVALNYLEKSSAADDFPKYREFHMVGFSGGGWTTTVYAALDERIRVSISVSGSIPLYLRYFASIGDVEQNDPALYQLAGYPELYVMAAAGKKRRQIQVLNRRDSCCFGERQFDPEGITPNALERETRKYEQNVRATLKLLGARSDAFSVRFDDVPDRHTLSARTIEEIILPALSAQ